MRAWSPCGATPGYAENVRRCRLTTGSVHRRPGSVKEADDNGWEARVPRVRTTAGIPPDSASTTSREPATVMRGAEQALYGGPHGWRCPVPGPLRQACLRAWVGPFGLVRRSLEAGTQGARRPLTSKDPQPTPGSAPNGPPTDSGPGPGLDPGPSAATGDIPRRISYPGSPVCPSTRLALRSAFAAFLSGSRQAAASR